MPLDQLPMPGADQAPPDAAAAPAPPPAAAAEPLLAPFADVAQGKIHAVFVPPMAKEGKPTDAQSYITANFPDLLKSGLDYHETKDDGIVFYNPKAISLKRIEMAEKEGSLHRIAPTVTNIQGWPAPAAAGQGAPPPADLSSPPPPGLAEAPAPIGNPSAAVPQSPGPQVPTPPGIENARRQNLVRSQVSPIMPNPVPGRLAQRAV